MGNLIFGETTSYSPSSSHDDPSGGSETPTQTSSVTVTVQPFRLEYLHDPERGGNPNGVSVAIIGRRGRGKTTLMNAIGVRSDIYEEIACFGDEREISDSAIIQFFNNIQLHYDDSARRAVFIDNAEIVIHRLQQLAGAVNSTPEPLRKFKSLWLNSRLDIFCAWQYPPLAEFRANADWTFLFLGVKSIGHARVRGLIPDIVGGDGATVATTTTFYDRLERELEERSHHACIVCDACVEDRSQTLYWYMAS